MLVSNGVSVNTIPDIANTLAETFAKTSSCDNYTPAFQALKRREERVKLNFSSSNEEGYNSPLTLRELRTALHRSGNTAAGPDGLHYIMLRHLSESSILSLLSLFNRIWETHVFPTQWCHAHVLPFPKPGKDPTSAINYRPIALTSCLSKLMERMVSARLMFHLESHNLLSPLQSGFRKSRSTTDNLLRLETSIREAFVKKQYNISVFFDIKKAYDMSWRYGILRDLYAMDIRGNLPVFIKNFLNHRSFQVRLLSFYSNIFIQEQGVPQGSVLSVLLFIIKINSITHHINQGIQCSLYVDDVQISYSSKFLNVAQRHIQTTINNFTKWAEQNGFDFSTEKTVSVVFTRKRGVFPNPELFIGRSIIQVVNEVKFLGLIFDQSLRFHRHLKDLKIRSANALNILKVLANTHWGADRTSLLRLYRALIRSKLDYGSVVYSSACKSLLKILDPVHHQALRLCLWAFRTSPVESLYAEAYEPPLDLRRKYLCLNYFMKIQSMKTNTAYSYLFNFSLYDFNSHRSSLTYLQPFHFRIRDLINDLNLNIGRIALCKISEVPPWKVIYPKVDFTLSYYSKACTPESTYRTLYLEHRELFSDYEPIFTDGSKSESHVGSAVVSLSTVITDALPISASIYTAELHALRIALEHISLSCGKKFIIYTDSLSALQSIVSLHSSSHPILVDITYALANHLKKKDIRFCWIPGHAGITGNELADTAARSATGSSERFPIPHSDLKACFRLKLQSVWQSNWDQQTENKLHSIMPILAPTAPSLSNRREQVIWTRLRLGHTRLTHRHLLLGEPPPYCEKCNVSLSESWSQQLDNKLHSVKPVIGAWPVMPMRRTDVKLTRLRIGHTRFTHRHLLFGERAPECPSCNASLYVDDLQISCEGSDMRLIERQLQTAVNNIVKWCDTNGHSISASKSCCVHFCRKRGIHPDPEIRIRAVQIPVVPDVRFLGVIFDRRLTFLPHILQLRKRCEKSLNLLKVLSNTSWGADRTSLLRVYQAIVLSRIEYGCVVYGSACNSTLKKLDPVHHMALRICSGAFRTSPLQSLYVTCHQLPLDLRRRKLSLTCFYF
ncbi:probable RNA-directed DNA polymerase from transposon X-element [Trichonephila clavipes]|nr:probable RNA-directed DNA polymerase from transposon X-element [Trichonephila clavipes]